MKTLLLSDLFLAGFASIIFVFIIFSRFYSENEPEITDVQKQKYRPLFLCAPPALLFSVPLIILPFSKGTSFAAENLINTCFDLFLQHSLYYMLFLLILPVLRKHISSRICALLWLLPGYVYLLFRGDGLRFRPLYIIHASSRLVMTLLIIWLTGFYLFLLWNIAAHFLFRRKILKHAVPVTNPEILTLFHKEIDAIAFKKAGFPLITTEAVSTPLSIGLFRRSTKIILPHKDYSPDQLRMIFRHELIHISRGDSYTKFFLLFYAAMYWFNPFMWLILKKSAEDLELSCDETVLLNADAATRRQYADLILRTAGDSQGFSTCFSSSASSLRYRLKSIVNPGVRRPGVLVVGLSFFLLSVTRNYGSLAYGESTAASTVFAGNNPEAYTITRVFTSNMEHAVDTVLVTREVSLSVTRYIEDLPTQKITGNYQYYLYDEGPILSLDYDSPDGEMTVELHNDFIKAAFMDSENISQKIFHLPEKTDWDHIDRLLLPLSEK